MALGLYSRTQDLASIISGFSFTMLGFLAAIITILFAVVSSASFKRYSRVGYLDVLFFLYFFTLFCLVCTAFVSLIVFSSAIGYWGIRILIMLFVNNVVQIAIITSVICSLAKKASSTD